MPVVSMTSASMPTYRPINYTIYITTCYEIVELHGNCLKYITSHLWTHYIPPLRAVWTLSSVNMGSEKNTRCLRPAYVTRCSDDGWGRGETWTLLCGACGAAYILGCRKFSASLVNWQNDSSRHIICLDDFLYSSFSPNKNITHAKSMVKPRWISN